MNTEKQGLLSVIVPIYKVEEYLQKCVDSIINQTYTNLEIILVDDGSPDNCGKICDEYAAKDERIVVIHKANGGLSDARNAGIEIAKGEYLGFVDSDDYIAPDMYEVLMEDMLKTGVDMAICAVRRVYKESVFDDKRKGALVHAVLSAHDAMQFCMENSVTAWNKVYKRFLFSDIRYPIGKTAEDAFVIADILENVKSVSVNPRQLYYYVCRPDSITTKSFTEKNLDVIYAYEHVLEIVRRSFPTLEDYVKARLLWSNI